MKNILLKNIIEILLKMLLTFILLLHNKELNYHEKIVGAEKYFKTE